jgi:hypothetical protein
LTAAHRLTSAASSIRRLLLQINVPYVLGRIMLAPDSNTDVTRRFLISVDSRWMRAMAARQGFLLAIALSALMVVWWALSGPSALTTVCKATTPLTPYRGPFSSLCLSHYLSTGSTDSKESI